MRSLPEGSRMEHGGYPFQGPEAIQEEISMDETAEKLKLMSLVSVEKQFLAHEGIFTILNRGACAPWRFVVFFPEKNQKKNGWFWGV